MAGAKHAVASDLIIKLLGLDVCADTIVGSEMMRGISGGQKKRVTTGMRPLLDKVPARCVDTCTLSVNFCVLSVCCLAGIIRGL
jgi:hypothetical protein